jgi:hypothetical protein
MKTKYFVYIIAALHFVGRDWPMGGTLQTIADVSIIIAVIAYLIADVAERRREWNPLKTQGKKRD